MPRQKPRNMGRFGRMVTQISRSLHEEKKEAAVYIESEGAKIDRVIREGVARRTAEDQARTNQQVSSDENRPTRNLAEKAVGK